MNRPYPPDFPTHYDHADDHHNDMSDVLDPPELADLVDHLERSNVVYIKGERYIITHYSEVFPDGHIEARLRPEDAPF